MTKADRVGRARVSASLVAGDFSQTNDPLGQRLADAPSSGSIRTLPLEDTAGLECNVVYDVEKFVSVYEYALVGLPGIHEKSFAWNKFALATGNRSFCREWSNDPVQKLHE